MCNHRTANFGIGLPDALNLVFQFKELKSFCFELKYTEINWFNYKSIKGRYLYPVERICILCPSLCITCTCRHLYRAKRKGESQGKAICRSRGINAGLLKGTTFPAANDRAQQTSRDCFPSGSDLQPSTGSHQPRTGNLNPKRHSPHTTHNP